jgi:hypothetical protein
LRGRKIRKIRGQVLQSSIGYKTAECMIARPDPGALTLEPRVNSVEFPHAFAEIPVRRLHEGMVMVGHQAVGVDDPIKPSPHAREHVDKHPPVPDGPKNVLPSVTA